MNKKDAGELSGVKEIARRAGVSAATVDRVIHKRKGVSDKTRDRINAIIAELNYQPNLHAQRLASRKVVHIATFIPESSDETSFWEGPLKGIEDAEAEVMQYSVKLHKFFYNQDNRKSFVKQAKAILKMKPDGILLAPSFMEESVDFITACDAAGIPYVFMDSDIPGRNNLSYIGPDLYQSGFLAAHLVSYLLREHDKVLIVNISKEIDTDHHLLRKEEGFRAYYKEHGQEHIIIKRDIHRLDHASIEAGIAKALERHTDIRVIFVTNSRVSAVAAYVQRLPHKVILIGYDFLKENIDYLHSRTIDFLICQKPLQQAYKGVMALYQHIAFNTPLDKINYMPIDIITKENYASYEM
ncbi:LacI family DNA-binding transcriptional regulator [Chitinophaga lutea]|uniref:LacI family DNA-binding transcriptional regulator n=1 Tax=Chitinophaga lutea TaxID=2488634 RepID=A0A3N4PP64_9BACT|nr:substrate-binding domain-containing protein [Chitinophaga lutea]RPE09555.1 LacI family DNA-binding transcriptional regulator [Chitinophaga lutea]